MKDYLYVFVKMSQCSITGFSYCLRWAYAHLGCVTKALSLPQIISPFLSRLLCGTSQRSSLRLWDFLMSHLQSGEFVCSLNKTDGDRHWMSLHIKTRSRCGIQQEVLRCVLSESIRCSMISLWRSFCICTIICSSDLPLHSLSLPPQFRGPNSHQSNHILPFDRRHYSL